MEYKDYYKILGVPRDADGKVIKTAYRRLARKLHPDMARGSAEKFKEINEAYAVLSDADKRRRYDALGPDWMRYAEAPTGARSGGPRQRTRFERGGDLGDFSDFFKSVFGDLGGGGSRGGGLGFDFDLGGVDLGGGAAGARRGGDVEASLEITLEEAFQGARKTLTVDIEEACRTCGGAGHVARKPCRQCGGRGWARSPRRLEVKVPPGVDTGSRVRVTGEGATGPDGRRGDLYLLMTVTPHARFDRRGDDLHVDLPVAYTDAALGAELAVPTLRGQVSVRVPPATSSGRVLRIPGYGMPRLKGGGAGDQYIRVQVTIPRGLSAREQALLEELRRLRAPAAEAGQREVENG